MSWNKKIYCIYKWNNIFRYFSPFCIIIYFHPGMNFMTCWATVHILLSSPILLTVCVGKAVCSLTKVTYKQKCKTGTHFQMVSKPYMFEALVTTCMLWSERDKGGWYNKKDKQQQHFFALALIWLDLKHGYYMARVFLQRYSCMVYQFGCCLLWLGKNDVILHNLKQFLSIR